MRLYQILLVAGFAFATTAFADRCEEPTSASDNLLCPGRFCHTPVANQVFKSMKGLAAAAQEAGDSDVEVFASTIVDEKVNPLVPQAPVHFAAKPEGDAEVTYDLNPDKKMQRLDGFGANFTESCAMNLLRLPKKQRREVMEKMFSKSNGAGFDFLRLPVGASDFADGKKGSYSYNDTKGAKPDPQLKHFDMSRDEKSFKLLREAKEINPNLHVVVTPWSAPNWMKSAKSTHGGWLNPDLYQEYANYLVKTVKEYRKRGITVSAITAENEPLYATEGYPSMYMSITDQQRFLGDFLGPTFEKEKLGVRIFAHDHNWSQTEEVKELLSYEPARKYIDSVAFHCYYGERFNMYDIYNAYPEKGLVQTECTGTDFGLDKNPSRQDWDFQWWTANQSIGALGMGPTGTSGGLGWNLCLDEKNGPQNGIKNNPNIANGGCTQCRGMVKMDFSGKEPNVIYNGEFYALAQVSKFIVPGSHRVDMGGEAPDVNAVGIQNPDGSLVFAIQNERDKAVKFRVRRPNCDSFTYEIPARAAITFTWNKP